AVRPLARLAAPRRRPARATEDTVELARAHLGCARMLIEEGQAEQAGPHLARAERLLELDGESVELGGLRTAQSRWAAALGREEEALERAREAIETLDGHEGEGSAWYALGVAD